MNFVLVHGAYLGAWCWDKVADILDTQGSMFFSPDLSGLGERKNLLSPRINLSTHINDVVQLIKEESLEDVILVGHSYAGMVISGIAEILDNRIKHLVYLDAMLPQDGQSAFDIMPSARSRVTEISFNGEPVKVIMPPSPEVLGVTEPEDIASLKSLMAPMPAACYQEIVKLKNPAVRSIKKTYILCQTQAPGDSQKSHESAFERATGDNWQRLRIASAHAVMITHPQELSRMLLQLAA